MDYKSVNKLFIEMTQNNFDKFIIKEKNNSNSQINENNNSYFK